MKTYKDFDKKFIGMSDIASLVCRYPAGVSEIKFGEDGNYRAYLVDEVIDLPDHYTKVLSCNSWLWIYDDDQRTLKVQADTIEVYRAGEMGVLIYAPGGHFRLMLANYMSFAE